MVTDHIGIVSVDIEKFEKFWVKTLGFKQIFQSRISPEMNKALFGFEDGAYCARYKLGGMVIEVHVYDSKVEKELPFNRYGFNHIAFHVKDRKGFIEKHKLTPIVYHNPKGWDNIFIKDLEENWIELRTDL